MNKNIYYGPSFRKVKQGKYMLYLFDEIYKKIRYDIIELSRGEKWKWWEKERESRNGIIPPLNDKLIQKVV